MVSAERFAGVDTLLAGVTEDHVVPGVAAAAVVDGEVAHVATHGWRDLERALPVTPDTPSRWYSISKPLTALALARLVEAGRLKWDSKVSEFVPSARFADPVSTQRATIRDCLLHSTGLFSGDWTWVEAPSDPDELLRRLPHVPCRPGFRGGLHYQNFNFMLLGHVFRALGTDWHAVMREMLGEIGVRPLTRLAEFLAAPRMVGYGPNGFAAPSPSNDFDFEGIAPASAVCGSIGELALVARMAALGGKDLMSPQAFEEVTRPAMAWGDREWREMRQPCAAMAGAVVIYRGERALQWAGGFRGYVSHMVAIPERKAAACALANRTACAAAEALAWSMLDRAAGLDPLPWSHRYLEQKRRFRESAGRRMADHFARPVAPWPAVDPVGDFEHGGYGRLTVEDGWGLVFRNGRLPMRHYPDGTFVASGFTEDFSEITWEMRPEIVGGRVVAWLFNPDDRMAPCRFARVGSARQ